jgi:predicted O-linked N-acetylglucosamine transferase (SPINDLY family)
LRRACDWEKWRGAWQTLSAALPDTGEVVTPFSLLCEPLTPDQQLSHARRWSRQFNVMGDSRGDPPARHAQRARIRIGYFSSDFYLHATAYLLAEVLELHDRSQFEVFAFSYGPEDNSPMRARLRAACEHFTDIARDPDDVAAQHIREAQLDILIDLKGYTMGARPAILARRPCALQVSWLGYPGTMGADFIDCVIADPFIVPAEHERFYAERVLRLPHCYQPNDRKREIAKPLARADYGLPDDAFVFCCFNQSYKITPEIFACWMRLLKQVPDSVLWLLADNRWASENLRRAAQAHGIAAERVVFGPKLPLAQHLARYAAADLALDTLPYGSHTTASDALWGGCPLVALCGETFAARVSGSILTAFDLPELVTYKIEDYERLALQIATDEPLRSALRAKLELNKLRAPLFDSAAFTRDLEQLYREIIEKPLANPWNRR